MRVEVQAENLVIDFLIFDNELLIMLEKKKVIKSIKDLPDTFSLDELIDRILLIQKIEIGREQSRNGETLTTSEAKARLKKWLK